MEHEMENEVEAGYNTRLYEVGITTPALPQVPSILGIMVW